jgi:outer membrane protein assembly factor BamB
MHKLKNKTTAIVITLLLTLSMATAITFPKANAANFPGTTIPTWAYLQVVPDQVGLGQNVLMVMWIDKPPPTANGILGDRWVNMTLKITQPDGTIQTLGPFKSDDAGGYTANYAPSKLGNYSAVFTFSGETLTGSLGNDGFPSITSAVGDVYGASTSNIVHFTVSNEPYSLIPENPLPTGYWANPVQAFNHNWYTIDGNWLGTAAVEFANTGNFNFAGNFNPYTEAPLTGHVVWSQPLVPGSPGGQMGGKFGGTEESNYYSGFQYQPKFGPIILNGVLYYQAMPNYNAITQGFVALDLRTGTTLWTKNYLNYFANGSQDTLLCGQIYVYKTMNTYGGQAYLWATRSTGGVNYLDMFDAATGNYVLSISGSGSGGAFGRQNFEGADGSLLQLYTNSSGGRTSLTLWNSSHCLNPTDSQFYSLPQNGVIPYNQGIMWSKLLPNATSSGDAIPNFILDDTGHSCWDPDNNVIILEAGTGMVSMYGWNPGWLIEAAFSMTDGTQLWIKNQTETPFAVAMMCPGASNGIYAEYTKETMTWIGYSTATGQKVWGPTEPFINPLAYYDQTSAVCAYGRLYTWTFGGEVYCFNMTNGQKIWNWSTGDAGANTPYGVNPLWIIGNYEATVAGGVFYVETGHDYGPPLFSGAKIYALNATTGEPIWDILNFASGSSLPVTYGYMLSFNAYDNQIYCYGKGQTKTTVTTEPVINSNTEVQISGTVTDQSPGQTCLGIPAAGTPAIDDQYMSPWMEYLYMQSPKPTNATGVPVTLSYVDPNNNYYVIGTTTSDANGQYSYTFKPDIPGAYEITATFGGSNSYFTSSAQTHTTFVSPAAATASPTPQPASLADTYFLPMSIITIVAVVVIGALLALMLRKRP